jgi:hypothetical protein
MSTTKVERVHSAMETTSNRPLNENTYELKFKPRRNSVNRHNTSTKSDRRCLSIKSTSDLRV